LGFKVYILNVVTAVAIDRVGNDEIEQQGTEGDLAFPELVLYLRISSCKISQTKSFQNNCSSH